MMAEIDRERIRQQVQARLAKERGDLTTPSQVSSGKTGQESPDKKPPLIKESGASPSPRLNFLDQKVGPVGFLCPKKSARRISYRSCVYDCAQRCLPLPVLLALMERRNPSSTNQFSTTEFLNPPKPTWMKRHYPHWSNPYDLVWMTFGTAWHYVIEKQKHTLEDLEMDGDYVIENDGKSFRREYVTPSGVVILTGRPDLYIKPIRTLYDFKTMKYYYTLKYLLERKNWDDGTYHWQVNIYRKNCFPDAEKMYLLSLVKDWNSKVQENGVLPIEEIEVPFIKDAMLEEFCKSRLDYYHQCELDPSKIRDCLDEERWFTKRPPVVPLRCRDYCSVNYRCEQYQSDLMSTEERSSYFAQLKEEDEKNGLPYYQEPTDENLPPTQ